MVGRQKENVITFFVVSGLVHVYNRRTVPEGVPKGVGDRRSVILVVQIDREETDLWKCVKLVRLADAVVISIDPYAEARINGITGVDKAVAVPTLLRVVEHRQGEEAVWMGRRWLRCQITEEFGHVVYYTVAVPVEREPSV